MPKWSTYCSNANESDRMFCFLVVGGQRHQFFLHCQRDWILRFDTYSSKNLYSENGPLNFIGVFSYPGWKKCGNTALTAAKTELSHLSTERYYMLSESFGHQRVEAFVLTPTHPLVVNGRGLSITFGQYWKCILEDLLHEYELILVLGCQRAT